MSSYQDEVFHQFNQFRDRLFCDVVLQVEDLEVPAHRLLLSSASKYFLLLFTSDMKEKDQKKIRLKKVSPFEVQTCINFIYNKKTDIEVDRLGEILFCACLFELERLKMSCFEVMQNSLAVQNCLGFIALSRRFQCEDFERKGEVFLNENLKLVLHKSPEFDQMGIEFVSMCLQLESKALDDEVTLFEALVRWIKYSEEERKPFFCELFQFIRLPMMPKKYLCESIIEDAWVKYCVPCNEYATRSIAYQLLQSSKNLKRFQTRKRGAKTKIVVSSTNIHMFAITKFVTKIDQDGKFIMEEEYKVNNPYWNYQFCSDAPNNNIYQFTSNNQILCFNTKNKAWINRNVPCRIGQNAATCSSKHLYLIGGMQNNQHFSNSGKWDTTTSGKWDTTTYQWANLSNLKTARAYASTVIVDNKLYIMGGKIQKIPNQTQNFNRHQQHVPQPVNTVECLDLALNGAQWSYVKPMNKERHSNKVQVYMEKIYIIGNEGNTQTTSMEFYDPIDDVWTLLSANFIHPRHGFGLFVLFDKLMVFGGNAQGSVIEEWDEVTNTWKVSDMIQYEDKFPGACDVMVLEDVDE